MADAHEPEDAQQPQDGDAALVRLERELEHELHNAGDLREACRLLQSWRKQLVQVGGANACT